MLLLVNFLSLSLPLIPCYNLLPLLNTHERLFLPSPMLADLFPLLCERERERERKRGERERERTSLASEVKAKTSNMAGPSRELESTDSLRCFCCFASPVLSSLLSLLACSVSLSLSSFASSAFTQSGFTYTGTVAAANCTFLSPAQPCRWVTGGNGKEPERTRARERKTER